MATVAIQAEAVRPPAREERSPARTAECLLGMSIGEQHTILCEAVHGRRHSKRVTIAGQRRPQVVSDDQQNIRSCITYAVSLPH